jgi:hypothetical protein
MVSLGVLLVVVGIGSFALPAAGIDSNFLNSLDPAFLFMENDVTVAHAMRPSGESVGAPMRFTAQSASTSKGADLRADAARRAGILESCE